MSATSQGREWRSQRTRMCACIQRDSAASPSPQV